MRQLNLIEDKEKKLKRISKKYLEFFINKQTSLSILKFILLQTSLS